MDNAYLICPGCGHKSDLGPIDEPMFDLNTSCNGCGLFWLVHVPPGGSADIIGPEESFIKARYSRPSPFLTEEWKNRQPPPGYPYTVAILTDIIEQGDGSPRLVWRLDYATDEFGGKFASETMPVQVPPPYGHGSVNIMPWDWARNGASCITDGFDPSQLPQY